jgi:hypothetical protein
MTAAARDLQQQNQHVMSASGGMVVRAALA